MGRWWHALHTLGAVLVVEPGTHAGWTPRQGDVRYEAIVMMFASGLACTMSRLPLAAIRLGVWLRITDRCMEI